MIVPLRTDSKTRRKRELRALLEPEQVRRRGRLQLLRTVRAYILKHYKAILAVLVVGACAYTHIYYFNRLTGMRQQVSNLRGQVGGGLQMRQNIIPGLTVALNRFIEYEKGVMLTAVKARKEALSMSKDLEKLGEFVQELSGKDLSPESLSRFVAVAENYPQLASTQAYKLFIAQIGEVENQIYEKRIEYNEAVNEYNTQLSRFPANVVGRILGFGLEPYFTWDKGPEWVFVADPKSGEPPLRMQSEKNDLKE